MDFTQPVSWTFIIGTIVGFVPVIAIGIVLVNKFAPKVNKEN
ncbi:MAG: hypothetical protein OIF32_01310 [Campylobacterales bacterium]|nr:hypothetical protein [Campylobacterales bacterium]